MTISSSESGTCGNKNASQEFLDQQQYSNKGLLKYEEIFGTGFISTGGILTTEQFFARPEMQTVCLQGGEVLDVGCGIGGGDMYIAKTFPKMSVHGVDLATNCVNVAKARYANEASVQDRLRFQVADVLTCPLIDNHYALIYSRDVILHIFDKPLLFSRLFNATRQGGALFITDYCQADDAVFANATVCCDSSATPGTLGEWQKYVAGRGYTLYSVSKYAETLQQAGWTVEKAEDQTAWFREIMLVEMTRVTESTSLSEDDKKELIDGWKAKIQRIDAGFMKWGAFFARKL
jgi:phosphoethanolamine N-methyltransferase